MKIVDMLRNPAFDWPDADVLARAPTLWMVPIIGDRVVDAHHIAQQPMYPLRKLLAQAHGCYIPIARLA